MLVSKYLALAGVLLLPSLEEGELEVVEEAVEEVVEEVVEEEVVEEEEEEGLALLLRRDSGRMEMIKLNDSLASCNAIAGERVDDDRILFTHASNRISSLLFLLLSNSCINSSMVL